MKRLFDIAFSTLFIILLLPIFCACAIAIRLTSKGPILHRSKRIGARNKEFIMFKFRTMNVVTPQLATHLMTNPKQFLTPIGGFLRKTSIDELPQLFNILRGEMSIVGPRPALYNQYDQINLRIKSGCHILKPGITGWAQVNGRDNISIEKKVEYDAWYYTHRSFFLDLKIILITIINVIKSKNISH